MWVKQAKWPLGYSLFRWRITIPTNLKKGGHVNSPHHPPKRSPWFSACCLRLQESPLGVPKNSPKFPNQVGRCSVNLLVRVRTSQERGIDLEIGIHILQDFFQVICRFYRWWGGVFWFPSKKDSSFLHTSCVFLTPFLEFFGQCSLGWISITLWDQRT